MSKMERLDRSHWKHYQNLMQDSIKFVELLHSIDWEDGLTYDTTQCELYCILLIYKYIVRDYLNLIMTFGH